MTSRDSGKRALFQRPYVIRRLHNSSDSTSSRATWIAQYSKPLEPWKLREVQESSFRQTLAFR